MSPTTPCSALVGKHPIFLLLPAFFFWKRRSLARWVFCFSVFWGGAAFLSLSPMQNYPTLVPNDETPEIAILCQNGGSKDFPFLMMARCIISRLLERHGRERAWSRCLFRVARSSLLLLNPLLTSRLLAASPLPVFLDTALPSLKSGYSAPAAIWLPSEGLSVVAAVLSPLRVVGAWGAALFGGARGAFWR